MPENAPAVAPAAPVIVDRLADDVALTGRIVALEPEEHPAGRVSCHRSPQRGPGVTVPLGEPTPRQRVLAYRAVFG